MGLPPLPAAVESGCWQRRKLRAVP